MGRVFSILCFIHPLPPMGYSHLSQGESLLQQNITAPADCPPETGGTSEAEGVDSFHFSVFTFPFIKAEGVDVFTFPFNKPPSNVGNAATHLCFTMVVG